MAGEDDLVSKVSVTGTEESVAKLDAFAKSGEAAFNRVDAAAQKAAADISKAGKDIERGAGDAQRGLNQLGNTNTRGLLSAAPNLKLIEQGANSLTSAMRRGIPAIASFVARLSAAGTAAAAAGVGLLKVAQNVAQGSKTQATATDSVTAAQIASNNASLNAQIGAINLESQQRKLFQQLQSGQITYSEYSKALTQLNADYKEQQRVAAQTERAQERVRLENERLQKQAADTKAFQAQVDMFGGPLLSSLTALGSTATQLFNQFKQAFGPAIATAIDLITGGLTKNSGAISAFFNDASTKLNAFIAANGPAIEQAFNAIGTAIKTVFDGIIAALPGLLTFFNNNLVPAIKGLGTLLSGVATAINSIFGTQLTAGAVAIIAIIGTVTGSFKALITAVRIFFSLGTIIAGLPFGPVILLIVAAITLLLIAFPQLRQVALDVLNSVITAFQGLLAGALAAGQGVIAAWNAMITFFTTLFAAIGNVFTTAWNGLAAGVTATIDAIKAAWNATVQFFQDLVNAVVKFFTDMGTSISDSFKSAFDKVKQWFSDLWESAKAKLQPILDILKAIKDLAASALSGGSGDPTVAAAGGGHVRGPGTSTSDSIPAWLSDGEFVVKAKSVSKYGAGLLHAINSGQFRMPKFNMGGLVSSMMSAGPRLGYADGGEVSGPNNMRPLNLHLFGEEFNGLMAPEDVGSRLTKFAVARQNKSAGRKPEWLGRGRNNA